jgi:CRISPR/Cas system CSM-associated protein Csm2 small subunit
VASSIVYLISLAVNNRIPMVFLETFQTIHHQLTFGRITLDEAIAQVDLLFAGKSLGQALEPHFNRLMIAIREVQTSLPICHDEIMNLKNQFLKAKQFPTISSQNLEAQKEINLKLNQFRDFFKTVQKSVNEMKKMANSFRFQRDYLLFLSPKSESEVQIFSEQLEKLLSEIVNQMQKLDEEWEQLGLLMREDDLIPALRASNVD